MASAGSFPALRALPVRRRPQRPRVQSFRETIRAARASCLTRTARCERSVLPRNRSSRRMPAWSPSRTSENATPGQFVKRGGERSRAHARSRATAGQNRARGCGASRGGIASRSRTRARPPSNSRHAHVTQRTDAPRDLRVRGVDLGREPHRYSSHRSVLRRGISSSILESAALSLGTESRRYGHLEKVMTTLPTLRPPST